MPQRRSHDWTDEDVRAWHVRYSVGESVNAIAASLPYGTSPASVYYHFARLGLALRNGYLPSISRLPNTDRRIIPFGCTDGRDVRREVETPGPVAKKPFAGPPIYRSEFIRGVAERKMTAGR